MNKQPKAIFILIIGILAISTAGIFIKLCSDMPSLLIAFYRMFFSSIILVAVTLFGKKITRYTPKQILFGALGGLCLALHFAAWISSIKYTTIASSVVIVTTNPVWVALFSYLFFREKQSKRLFISIFLSLLGSFILAVDGSLADLAKIDSTVLKGDLLALAGAISASLYFINGNRMRQKMEVLPYTTLVYTFSAIFLAIMVIISGESFAITNYSNQSILFVLFLAIVPQLVGHTAFSWSLRYFKTSVVAIAVLGEPIGSALLAFLIFHEKVSLIQFGGIILIFVAVLLSFERDKEQQILSE